MNRPWVICHMCTSLDGKISGDFMETATAAPALRAYNELRGFYDCRATLYGTTTMLGGYANGLAQLDENFASVARRITLRQRRRKHNSSLSRSIPKASLAISRRSSKGRGARQRWSSRC